MSLSPAPASPCPRLYEQLDGGASLVLTEDYCKTWLIMAEKGAQCIPLTPGPFTASPHPHLSAQLDGGVSLAVTEDQYKNWSIEAEEGGALHPEEMEDPGQLFTVDEEDVAEDEGEIVSESMEDDGDNETGSLHQKLARFQISTPSAREVELGVCVRVWRVWRVCRGGLRGEGGVCASIRDREGLVTDEAQA